MKLTFDRTYGGWTLGVALSKEKGMKFCFAILLWNWQIDFQFGPGDYYDRYDY